jgi:hypothetical protein
MITVEVAVLTVEKDVSPASGTAMARLRPRLLDPPRPLLLLQVARRHLCPRPKLTGAVAPLELAARARDTETVCSIHPRGLLKCD